MLIVSPPELAGMTLESRLVSYDWDNQFDVFQKVTRNGSFRPICTDAKNNLVPVSTIFIRFYIVFDFDAASNMEIGFWVIDQHLMVQYEHTYSAHVSTRTMRM